MPRGGGGGGAGGECQVAYLVVVAGECNCESAWDTVGGAVILLVGYSRWCCDIALYTISNIPCQFNYGVVVLVYVLLPLTHHQQKIG